MSRGKSVRLLAELPARYSRDFEKRIDKRTRGWRAFTAKAAKYLAGTLKSPARGGESAKVVAKKGSKSAGADLLKSSLGTSEEISDYLRLHPERELQAKTYSFHAAEGLRVTEASRAAQALVRGPLL